MSGTTLLETIGIRAGRAPLWPLHLERLRRSAAALGLALPEAIPRPGGGGDHVLRYAVADGRVYVAGRPLEALPELRLRTSAVMHTGYPHKTDDRNWLDDARVLAVQQEADDALLLNAAGFVVEATIWAIGWWDEDVLVFPALTLAGLPSVARRRAGELVKVRDGRVRRADLGLRSMLACNAARGIVRVSSLDGEDLPEDSRTGDLQRRFWDRPSA